MFDASTREAARRRAEEMPPARALVKIVTSEPEMTPALRKAVRLQWAILGLVVLKFGLIIGGAMLAGSP